MPSPLLPLLIATALLALPARAAEPTAAEKACLEAFDQRLPTLETRCRLASEQGSALAAYRLGETFEHGLIEEADLEAAAHWYRQAADQGFALAQRNLAALYEHGQGVNRDPWHAFALYQRAAEQGQAHSQLKAGLMLLDGYGTVQDREQGLRWIHRAANAGEANAQHVIAELLFDQDPQQALTWFEKAVAQGHSLAAYRLGLIYFRGEGVAQDLDRALSLAEMGIREGNEKSRALKEHILAKVDPAKPPLANPKGHWLASMPEKHYTIQLAVLRRTPDPTAFEKRYRLPGRVRHYRTLIDNKPFNILIYGEYKDIQAARAALAALPEPARKLGPWVRAFGTLQRKYPAAAN